MLKLTGWVHASCNAPVEVARLAVLATDFVDRAFIVFLALKKRSSPDSSFEEHLTGFTC